MNHEKTHNVARRLPWSLALVKMGGDAVSIALMLALLGAMGGLPSVFGFEVIDGQYVQESLTGVYYVMYGALIVGMFALRGHYTQRVPWWSQIKLIVELIGCMTLIDIIVRLLFDFPVSLIASIALAVIIVCVLIIVRLVFIRYAKTHPSWTLPVCIIGDAPTVEDAFYAFYADGFTGYEVRTILLQNAAANPLDMSFLPSDHPDVEVIDMGQGFDDYILEHDYVYMIAIEGFRGERRDRLMRALEQTDRPYAIIPSAKRLHLYGMTPHYFFGNDIMLLHKRYSSVRARKLFVKRVMDVVGSGVVLPFIGLLAMIVWVAKKREGSTSPLFYNGMRIGRDGKLFPCWKFCTMHKNADQILQDVLDADPAARKEWDTFQKIKNDPRVDSSISRFLRKTSLDELPQIWNIFLGDMSIVGPRPMLPEQEAEYGGDFGYYTSMRPGLTGLWQVSGRNEASFKQRVVWDNWYVRNWSIWHDVVIIFKTMRVFATGSGAY